MKAADFERVPAYFCTAWTAGLSGELCAVAANWHSTKGGSMALCNRHYAALMEVCQ